MGGQRERWWNVVTVDPGHQCDLCGNQWTKIVHRPELKASGKVAHLCDEHAKQFLAWGQFMVAIGTLPMLPPMTKAQRERWPQNKAAEVKVVRS